MEKTYYGKPISTYGQERGYVDYACLASTFNHVLCNNISEVDPYYFENLVSGCPYRYYNRETNDFVSEDEYNEMSDTEQRDVAEELIEVYQYYIVDEGAVNILKEAGELVWYSDKLDCFIWGVTHYGTAWDYVVTSIKIKD